MLSINTNISSLMAMNSLAQSQNQLQTSLTRLSTGLRINSAADDPSGMIANEELQTEIANTNQAVANSQSASEMISTADSALSQIDTLLTNIGALVTQAANTGSMSADQISANQLQVDSSLAAINQIAQSTQFAGKSLLDGSLGFTTQGVNASQVSNLAVSQANFGTQPQMDVNVKVANQATQAALTYNGNTLASGATLQVAGTSGSQTFNFAAGATVAQIASAVNGASDTTGVQAALTNSVAATATKGQVTLQNADGSGGMTVQANTAGQYAGDFTINYVKDSSLANGAATAQLSVGSPNVIQVNVAANTAAAPTSAGTLNIASNTTNYSTGTGSAGITITANNNGSQFNGMKFNLVEQATGTESAVYDNATNTLTVTANASDTQQNVINLINNAYGSLFTAADATATAKAGSAGAINLNAGGTLTLSVVANQNGSQYNGVELAYAQGAAHAVSYNQSTNTLNVTSVVGDTAATLQAYLNGAAAFNQYFTATVAGAGTVVAADAASGQLTNGAGVGGQDLAHTVQAADAQTGTAVFNAADSFGGAGSAGAITVAGAGGGAGTISIEAKTNGTQFNGMKFDLNVSATSITDNAQYSAATNTLTVNVNTGESATQVATAITNTYGSLFNVSVGGGAGATAAGNDQTNTVALQSIGNDGGDVTATLGNIATAINAIVVPGTDTQAFTAALLSGTAATTVADLITNSATIGQVNSTAVGATDATADQPNNDIQLTSTDAGSNLPINFVAGGPNQQFSITYNNNTRTNGLSTAYLQGTGGGIIQIASDTQGTAFDGTKVTVNVQAPGSTDQSVVYNQAAKTITINTTAALDSTANIAAQINGQLGGQFTATVVSAAAAGSFSNGDTATTADGQIYDSVNVNLATDANGNVTTTAAQVINAINNAAPLTALGISASNVTSSNGSGVAATGTATLSELGVTAANAAATGTTAAANGDNAEFTVTALNTGAAYQNVKIAIAADDPTVTTSSGAYATYDSTQNVLTFHIAGGSVDTTASDLVNDFNTGSGTAASVKALFGVAVSTAGNGTANVTTDDVGYLGSGVTYSGTTTGGVNSQGNFDAGQVVGTSGLTFQSIGYGSQQSVSVTALDGTSFNTYTTSGGTQTAATTANGTDANVLINGVQATANGLNIDTNTANLGLNFNLNSAVAAGSSFDFQITGGGALFQLGAQIVSGQQARLGIASVNTADLGGSSGTLYDLGTGGSAALAADGGPAQAAQILQQAQTQIDNLRGQLGAFTATTLDTNMSSLQATAQNLTTADSTIEDADFAAESANESRAQVLVQAGTQVLSVANQMPQNVLTLLKNM